MSFNINKVIDSIKCIINKQNRVNPEFNSQNIDKIIETINPFYDDDHDIVSQFSSVEDLKTLRSSLLVNNFFK